jgi:hypothetical protein
MTPMQVALERGGRFKTPNMKLTPSKCGAMRMTVYEYFVRVTAFDTKLTAEGFILNNEQVQGYFDHKWGKDQLNPWEAISCELMALTAAKELCKIILAEGVSVHSVLCRIKGSNGAWIEALCQPEDATTTDRGVAAHA